MERPTKAGPWLMLAKYPIVTELPAQLKGAEVVLEEELELLEVVVVEARELLDEDELVMELSVELAVELAVELELLLCVAVVMLDVFGARVTLAA